MQKKRAQITVFIILGIVIIIIFSLLYRVSIKFNQGKLDLKAQEVLQNIENTEGIIHYLNLCLKQSAEDTLILIGQQGGRIYDYQNGSSSINKTYYLNIKNNNESFNVSYALFSPKLEPYPNSSYPNVPWYPEQTKKNDYIDISKKYYLGDNLLPFLCDQYGPNKYNASRNISGASCWMRRDSWYWSNTTDTVQIQIADYASYLLKGCIDPGYIKNLTNYDLDFLDPIIITTFGENDVSFSAHLPINISFKVLASKQTSTKNLILQQKIPVRIKRIFDLISEVVDKDKLYLGFDVMKDYSTTSSYMWLNQSKGHVEIVKIQNSLKNDDLLILTDHNSMIRGVPYTFQVLLKNRIPVLDWIHYTPSDSDYDIIVSEGTIIRISPIGYDPDEDYYFDTYDPKDTAHRIMSQKYNYSGWMETYSYYFNYSCCLFKNLNVTECLKNDTEGGCVVIDSNIKPHKWTNSNAFKSTSRYAEYNISREDFGVHDLVVSVCDSQNFCDFQTVRIKVYLFPRAVANSKNSYSDIDNEYASIEDPYTLDATGSSSFNVGALDQFMWCDNLEKWCYDTINPLFDLPYMSYDINNISSGYPDKSGIMFNITGGNGVLHNLSLTIGTGASSNIDTINVNVLKCLPHRGNAAPYPFNKEYGYNVFGYNAYTNVYDPFLANHTCCLGDPKGDTDNWNYASSNMSCYDFLSYGGFWSFDIGRFTGLSSVNMDFFDYLVYWENISYQVGDYPSYLLPPYDYSISTYNYSNDIYKREFETFCRGDRGNICDNNPTGKRTIAQSCDDILDIGQSEKCSGPNINYFAIASESNAQLSCDDYGPGDSFEKELFDANIIGVSGRLTVDDSDGQCNEAYQCTDAFGDGFGAYDPFNSNGHINSNSNYLCKAQCNGDGTCSYADGANNGISWQFGDTCIDCRCYARENNSAIVLDYNLNPSDPSFGKCISGQIYECNPSYDFEEDTCSKDNTKSQIEYDNHFAGCDTVSGCRFYIYSTIDLDGVCGIDEMCDISSPEIIDPDDNLDVCKLLRFNFTGDINQPKGFDDNVPYYFNETVFGASFYGPANRRCCYDDVGEVGDRTELDLGIDKNLIFNYAKLDGCRDLTGECVFEYDSSNDKYFAYAKNKGYPGDAAWPGGGYPDVDNDNDKDFCFSSGLNKAKWHDCPNNLGFGADSYCNKNDGKYYWCDTTSMDCKDGKNNGDVCSAGRECNSGNCIVDSFDIYRCS